MQHKKAKDIAKDIQALKTCGKIKRKGKCKTSVSKKQEGRRQAGGAYSQVFTQSQPHIKNYIIQQSGKKKESSSCLYIIDVQSAEQKQRLLTTSPHTKEMRVYFGTEQTGNRFAGVVTQKRHCKRGDKQKEEEKKEDAKKPPHAKVKPSCKKGYIEDKGHFLLPTNTNTKGEENMGTQPTYVETYKIALYIGKEGASAGQIDWTRVCKSTAFEVSMNPDIKEFQFIADKYPTKEVVKYAPQINQPLVMYKGSKDYELLFPFFFEMRTGTQAKLPVMVIFFQEKAKDQDGQEIDGSYLAWCSKETLASVSSLNSVEGTITIDLDFGGSLEKGVATKDDTTGAITFTAKEEQ